MRREVYLWAVLIVAIAAVAFYFRFFYQPTISIALGISPAANAQIYPYQKSQFDINVFNNGSNAVSNMSLGVLVNGNLTTLYKVTLPAGKQATIIFNYSPTLPGSYAISVVADPSKLYNIGDRSHSQAYASLSVLVPENASPSSLLPKSNITLFRHATLTNGAYLLGSYLYDQFNVSTFTLTGNRQLDAFLKPIFNLTSYYIKNMSVGEANYSNNGSAVYSIWVKGYLSPSIFSAATIGSHLSTANVTTAAGTVIYVKMLNDTTFCGWYAGGWLQVLAEKNSVPCYTIINESSADFNPVQMQGLGSRFGAALFIPNSTSLANYSLVSRSGDYIARLSIVSNSTFVYDTISNGTSINATCFGLIGEANGTSYCNTYIPLKSGKFGSFALIRTTAYKGGYNLSAFSLVNTSLAVSAAVSAEGILQKLNVSGPSVVFKSGVIDTCEFNDSFGCGNVSYSKGNISLKITNKLNASATLNSIKCYQIAGIVGFTVNKTLQSGGSTTANATCYSVSTPINGTALNIHLTLALNYTVSNTTRTVLGSAFIPFG
ncbi:MAG: hypothetical protein KGH57_01950 [Candidatus Micrarchaeota archaeon]|nr:hypothetical protein [Candidatus Micrarchaeota archaeon]